MSTHSNLGGYERIGRGTPGGERPVIINIINFIRACEPREPVDLFGTVVRQAEVLRRHNLKGSWLIQYDAMLEDRYVDLCRQLEAEGHEIGGWYEIVEPLTRAVGLPWRGRWAWDWHGHCGYPMGYTPADRLRLADEFCRVFVERFGRTPRSVGSWIIDAVTLAHLHDRHGLLVSCNCKDQWGTDGMTLWGGYWGQAYYPSRVNGFMPAQTAAGQVPVPVFRMLGSDPIYQYDHWSTDGERQHQGVISLEPVYKDVGGGGDPRWVRWFFEMLKGESLEFAYVQVGQENSFGWDQLGVGFTDQCHLLAQLRGQLRIERLEDTGRWFRDRYPVTPATAVTALTDWRDAGRQSVWFDSRNFRANLFVDERGVCLRDFCLFDERYPERYLNAVCTGAKYTYDTLPVICGAGGATNLPVPCGWRPMRKGAAFAGPLQVEKADGKLVCRAGELCFRFDETGFDVTAPGGDWHIDIEGDVSGFQPGDAGEVSLAQAGFNYSFHVRAGALDRGPDGSLRLSPGAAGIRVGINTGR